MQDLEVNYNYTITIKTNSLIGALVILASAHQVQAGSARISPTLLRLDGSGPMASIGFVRGLRLFGLAHLNDAEMIAQLPQIPLFVRLAEAAPGTRLSLIPLQKQLGRDFSVYMSAHSSQDVADKIKLGQAQAMPEVAILVDQVVDNLKKSYGSDEGITIQRLEETFHNTIAPYAIYGGQAQMMVDDMHLSIAKARRQRMIVAAEEIADLLKHDLVRTQHVLENPEFRERKGARVPVLHINVMSHNFDLTRAAVIAGQPLEYCHNGSPALVQAVRTYDSWRHDLKQTAKIMMYLVSRGAMVDAVDNYGMSALHHAMNEGIPELAALLLDLNANPHLRSHAVDGHPGLTAYEFGLDRGVIVDPSLKEDLERRLNSDIGLVHRSPVVVRGLIKELFSKFRKVEYPDQFIPKK